MERGRPIVKYMDTLQWAVQKRLNWSRYTVWVMGSDGPKELSIRGSPDPAWKGVILRGKGGALLSVGTLYRELCKNGWIGRDAIWDVDSAWQRESCVRWGFRSPHAKGAVFTGKDIPRHAWRYSAVSYAKMAEPIEMPFALWTRVGPRKHVLRGGAPWRHLLNTIAPSMCGGYAACCQITFDH